MKASNVNINKSIQAISLYLVHRISEEEIVQVKLH